jgi:hypothetical protein
MSQANPTRSSWRDVITVHPAADLLPLLGKDELRELADDIKANGLHEPVKIIERGRRQPNGSYDPRDMEQILIDGRNRLDAMELAGLPIFSRGGTHLQRDCFTTLDLDKEAVVAALNAGTAPPVGDVLDLNGRQVTLADYVISMNIKRRHLTGEQKHELIAKLMKIAPEKSDRQIAAQTKASPSTVGKVRKELEQTGDVSKLDTRTDAKGRKQPASKPKAEQPASNQRICDEVASKMTSALNSLNDRPASKPKPAGDAAAVDALADTRAVNPDHIGTKSASPKTDNPAADRAKTDGIGIVGQAWRLIMRMDAKQWHELLAKLPDRRTTELAQKAPQAKALH